MNEPITIIELLRRGADGDVALSGNGGAPMTYATLRALVSDTVMEISRHAIGAGDRVAILAEDTPEIAAAALSVACGAAAALLDPSSKADDFERALTDFRARLLIVREGANSAAAAAAAAAQRLNIPVARLQPDAELGVGAFTLSFGGRRPSSAVNTRTMPRQDDVALVLHTAGVAGPKVVTLTHGEICESATRARESKQITARDRSSAGAPLCQLDPLVATVLAPLAAGAEVSFR